MAWECLKATKPKIFVAIPHTGTWSAEFTEFTYGRLRFIPVNFADKITTPSRAGSLTVARNMLAKAFLEDKDATHIFWLDSDIVITKPPDPNEALRLLLSCNAPIVSGLYLARQTTGFRPSMWVKVQGGYSNDFKYTGNWFSVDAIGLGCCLVQRQVFEKIPYPYFHWDDEPSEDFYFCEQCKKAGFDIKVFTEVQASHIGLLAVDFDGKVRTLRV